MAIPAPNLSTMTIPQLLQALSAGMAGSPMHQQATIMLQFRVAEKQAEAGERQAEASTKMVESTDRLVAATTRLGEVTWWLVVATLILSFAAVIQLVVMLYLRTK